MRIIKQGQLPEEKVFRCECSNCQTVFECTRAEGKYIDGGQRDGSWLEVNCPVCKKACYAYPKKSSDSLITRTSPHSWYDW